MNRSITWIGTAGVLLAAGMLAAGTAAAWDCTSYPARRVQHFQQLAALEIKHCKRRAGTECPDAKLQARLDRLAGRIGRVVTHRCPDVAVDRLLAAARAELVCAELDVCAPHTMTVSVGGSSATTTVDTRAAVASALATEPSGRRLRADAGWTGLIHDLQILEGASYTAELSGCDGATDTLCDLHGATAGTAFGAPSPLSGGGVSFCVTVGFVSDLTGTYDLASGALAEEATVDIGVYLGETIDRPCPSCIPADGDPAIGEAGTCVGGPNAGASCHVEGLGDPLFGAARGTSADCGAGETPIATFRSHARATTGDFAFAPSDESPKCVNMNFIGERCLCSTCNDADGTACRSDADCPESGGAPGICGGRRCLNGSNVGAPCTSASQCPDEGACGVPGEPLAHNSCIDQVCTPTGDGRGECLEGPYDQYCEVAHHRGCSVDDDCPAGDRCIVENRHCSLDTIALDGTPDVAVAGTAHPTLVGGFCMGAANSFAVNAIGGFPGPVTYVWPTEIHFGE